MNGLPYAGDIVLVTSSAQQLQNMLRRCKRHSRNYEYGRAPDKCEVIPPVKEETHMCQ